jgi:DNA-binding transcriptional MerR regulator
MDSEAMPAADAPNRPLRMRDLTAGSRLSRQAIHHYIGEGLLPPPVKSGRNSAVYSEEHLERLEWIQKLQREHFLSLTAIKSVLNGDDVEAFSPEQKQVLRRVRDQLPAWARPPQGSGVPVGTLVGEHLTETELDELAAAGLITIHGGGQNRRISLEDSEIVECFVRYRQAGATRERGYRPGHLATIDQALDAIVAPLASHYAKAWQDAPAEEAAAFLEAVAPIRAQLIGTLFRKKFRLLIEAVADGHADITDG